MNYASHPEDLRRLIDGARLCWEIMHSDEIAQFTERVIAPRPEVMKSENALADYVRRTTSTTWHICGTARMGRSTDPLAVTDQQGRVHQVENLRVADASIMPDIVSCNTNLTSHHDRRTRGGVTARRLGLFTHPDPALPTHELQVQTGNVGDVPI